MYDDLLKIILNFRDRICDPAVFILTMQKTGSTSLINSLKSCGLKRTYRAHTFEDFNESYSRFTEMNRRIKIISIVRDPIEQSISHFFDAFRRSLKILNIQELVTEYNKHYGEDYFSSLLNWFDNHFQRVTGIDIFQYPYNREENFGIFSSGRKEILIFASEISDQKKRELIKYFLGIRNFNLERIFTRSDIAKNIGMETENMEILYNDFKRAISFPPCLLDKIYYSKFCRFFYSPTQLEAQKNRWRKNEE